LLFSFCGHITSFVVAIDELAGPLGTFVGIPASPVHPRMSVVPPVDAPMPSPIVIVGPPSEVVPPSMWIVAQLGTPVPDTMRAVPFRLSMVLAHSPVKSLSDACVGTLGAAAPAPLPPVLRTMSPVPFAMALAPSLDSLVRPANAFVGPPIPPVQVVDVMVGAAMLPCESTCRSSRLRCRSTVVAPIHARAGTPDAFPPARPAAGRETRWSRAHHCRRAAPDHRPAEG
jgi:hypothetical protein